MHRVYYTVAAVLLSSCSLCAGKTKLIIEVNNSTIARADIEKFFIRAINAFDFKNITATISDLNECESLTLNTCSKHAKCTNLNGSYSCECLPSFQDKSEGRAGTNCSDIDECANQTHNCHENSTCINTIGGYNCTCHEGLWGDGRNCTDIDECAVPAHTCSSNAICDNSIGSYSCTCKTGFVGDGLICTDTDECVNQTHNCHENATCTNTIGYYNCTCQEGLQGDGQNCTDTDECADETHNCHDGAACINTIGGFNCQCHEGLQGDGRNCTDIDECSDVAGTCSNNAFCDNNVGSYSCTCKPGFDGDGVTCTARATTTVSAVTTRDTTISPDTMSTIASTNFSMSRAQSTNSISTSTSEWTTLVTPIPKQTTNANELHISESATFQGSITTAAYATSGHTQYTPYETAAETTQSSTTNIWSSAATLLVTSTASTTSYESTYEASTEPQTTIANTDQPQTTSSTKSATTDAPTKPSSSTDTTTIFHSTIIDSSTTKLSSTPEVSSDATELQVSHTTAEKQLPGKTPRVTATPAKSSSYVMTSASSSSNTASISKSQQIVDLPEYDGNRAKYLASLNTLLDNLPDNAKLDINATSSTINTFETLVAEGADETLVSTTTNVVIALFDASVDGGTVVMTAGDSEKITRFLPNALESMQLTNGVYDKTDDTLALRAVDVDSSAIDAVSFKPTGGSVELPKTFVESAKESVSRVTSPSIPRRIAFTRYSDSRFFSTNDVQFLMSGAETTSSMLPSRSSIINSPVIGASIADQVILNAPEQATITLDLLIASPVETKYENGTKEVTSFTGNPRCVWWDYNARDWSESGCNLASLSNGTATCKCNHLTSFAVIMTVEKTVEDKVLSYLSYLGAALSIVGLLLTILTYSIFRSLRKSRSKRILLHFAVALCGVYITYVLGIASKIPSNQIQCIASGFFMHFFTLSVMAWMSVEVFDMYIMFVRIMQIRIQNYLLKATLIAWVSPLLAALVTLIVYVSMPDRDIYPRFNGVTTVCWLGKAGMLYAFIIPSSIILIVNLVLFCIVLHHVTCKRNRGLVGRIGRRSGKNIKASQHLINALALLLLAGPTWIIGYLINVEPVEDGVLRRILSYVFVILNAFQGFWIFIVFCVRPPSVRNKWVNLIRHGQWDDHSTFYHSSSSQRHTTKATSLSPRTSIYPESPKINASISKNTKEPVATTYSNTSSNSNNSNAKSSSDGSTSPLTMYSFHNKTLVSLSTPTARLETKVNRNLHRRRSINSTDTESIAESENNPVMRI